jgi:glutamate-1-semialdehyde 2,1-aminomutase
MGWGALLLGHSHPAVAQALRKALERGTLFGLTHPAEVELARLIAESVPSVEQVRFTVSGTEACMSAVRLARAYTRRTTILTFEGCYHGHGESLLAGKTAGLSEHVAQDIVTSPFNDLEAFEHAVQRNGDRLACVIIEPVAANMGVITPDPGYLARLRELTHRHGILLIFDEVVTGFRLGLGGAQALFGVTPDLTTFGKIIGGGLPIGAVGGATRVMQRLTPAGDVFHGGTFAGHPLSMAAGIATLRELSARPPYARLEQLSQRFADGLADAARHAGLPVQVNRAGSMLTAFFSEAPVRNAAQARASRRDRFAQWANALRRQGILMPPSPAEAFFVSAAHTDSDVHRVLHASAAALTSLSHHA